MRWASAVSTEQDTAAAIRAAIAAIQGELDGSPDLIVAFVSAHHREHYRDISVLLRREFASGLLIGCSAGGVIGGGKEVERRPGVSLTVAALPDVTLTPFHLADENLAAWQQHVALVPPVADPHFLLLAEPFTCDPEPFLKDLDRVYPMSRKIGGLASGGREPGQNALFLGDETLSAGLVGVALSGNVQVDTIVAQGCRPIGQPMFVTKCDRNIIWELDGQPALEVLQNLYRQLDAADQELARHSLFVGLVMNEQQHEYKQGDFLIRNIVGMDAERGLLAIGAFVHDGDVMQFHLRDAKTSAHDLEHMLSAYAQASGGTRPAGALLFSCLGRGVYLYGQADHDTNAFRDHLGAVPLGGFFCNGEIGPVQGATFLHGYTSAFGLFGPRAG